MVKRKIKNRPPRLYIDDKGRYIKIGKKKVYIKSNLTNNQLVKIVINNFLKKHKKGKRNKKSKRNKDGTSGVSGSSSGISSNQLAKLLNSRSSHDAGTISVPPVTVAPPIVPPVLAPPAIGGPIIPPAIGEPIVAPAIVADVPPAIVSDVPHAIAGPYPLSLDDIARIYGLEHHKFGDYHSLLQPGAKEFFNSGVGFFVDESRKKVRSAKRKAEIIKKKLDDTLLLSNFSIAKAKRDTVEKLRKQYNDEVNIAIKGLTTRTHLTKPLLLLLNEHLGIPIPDNKVLFRALYPTLTPKELRILGDISKSTLYDIFDTSGTGTKRKVLGIKKSLQEIKDF